MIMDICVHEKKQESKRYSAFIMSQICARLKDKKNNAPLTCPLKTDVAKSTVWLDAGKTRIYVLPSFKESLHRDCVSGE